MKVLDTTHPVKINSKCDCFSPYCVKTQLNKEAARRRNCLCSDVRKKTQYRRVEGNVPNVEATMGKETWAAWAVCSAERWQKEWSPIKPAGYTGSFLMFILIQRKFSLPSAAHCSPFLFSLSREYCSFLLTKFKLVWKSQTVWGAQKVVLYLHLL